ncbi:hypothetical protein HMPREF9720_0250 [Alistipes sp. HGB5]|nr:hypothetical protein HMPREF9720_0250 [Alistipes sp. HGB5]
MKNNRADSLASQFFMACGAYGFWLVLYALYTQSFSAFRTLGDCRFGRMICTIHKSRLTVSYAKIIFSA